MSTFLIFAACAFASSFSLRLIDPLVLPIAAHFGIASGTAAMLNPAYALPYALSQPFLGPLGDRFGRARCIQICMTGLAAVLLLAAVAPSFEVLLASRIAAGIFGGGLVPLVLAALGDGFAMATRQVMIGRMLFAMISGQMLGSVVAGFANGAFGWRSPFGIAAVLAIGAAGVAWWGLRSIGGAADNSAPAAPPSSFRTLYGRVFANPMAGWLFAVVFVEGMLFFGIFPFVGEALVTRAPALGREVSVEVGIVLGAFGIGGLLYALSVRRLIALLGVSRMCIVASLIAAEAYAAMALFGSWWQVAVAMLAAGLSFYMIHNSLQTEATELAPTARGSAVALFSSALFTGQGVGPLLFGPVVSHFGFAPVFLMFALAFATLGQVVVRKIVRQGAGRLPPAIA